MTGREFVEDKNFYILGGKTDKSNVKNVRVISTDIWKVGRNVGRYYGVVRMLLLIEMALFNVNTGESELEFEGLDWWTKRIDFFDGPVIGGGVFFFLLGFSNPF